jgi:hypothetical protein
MHTTKSIISILSIHVTDATACFFRGAMKRQNFRNLAMNLLENHDALLYYVVNSMTEF